MEPWRKVYINLRGVSSVEDIDFHLEVLSCVDCHQGDNSKPNSMEEAHKGLIVFPSRYDENGTNVCGNANCHAATVEEFRTSLHNKLWGYRVKIARRAGVQDFDQCPQSLKDGFNNECSRCHASCGDCHVAVPNDVGKGFISSHRFSSVPNQVNQCIACHGARVGYDFQGDYNAYPIRKRDVHANSLACIDCHDKNKLHSSASETSTRYTHENRASCTGCHNSGLDDANHYHQLHMNDMSCYVCHSDNEYQNCSGCHVDGAYLTDPVYQANNPAADFKIGLNHLQSEDRPYKYVTLRHIPIARDTYDNWGASGTLVDYDKYPTWKYTSPHSIQRWTTRTDTSNDKQCMESCHLGSHGDSSNVKYYLTRKYVEQNWPDEENANNSVYVDDQLPSGWLKK